MALFSKNILDLVKESAETDAEILDSIMDDEVLNDFDTTYKELNELPDDLFYEDASIPLYQASKDMYVVEADMLDKFMTSNKINNPVMAIAQLAEANNISADNIGVLFESSDSASDIIEEAKQTKSHSKKKKLDLIKKSSDFLKNLKNKGIKVFKKKSSKKK